MIAAVVAALLTSTVAPPPLEHRALIHQAMVLVDGVGERVWPGFRRAPFQVDLIEPDREFLFCRARENGFQPLGRDPVTGCPVQSRDRVLAPDLSASFSALGGAPVIAMGTPKALENDPLHWVFTVVHEDFHQFQSVIPGYAEHVRAIKPSDAIGDWMLSYPFPYADEKVGAAFEVMSASADAFLKASTVASARSAIRAYVMARRQARRLVPDADWRYYEFQVGQEGVARWTEMAIARAAGANDPDLAALAVDQRKALSVSLDAIHRQGLKMWKRSAFYVFGAIEAEMLEAAKPDWKSVYLKDPFSLGDQLAAIR